MNDELLFPLPCSDKDFTGDDLAKIRTFTACDLRHGAEVLKVFQSLVNKARQRGWPRHVGADTLRGWARGTVEGFSLHNDFAPFYVAALAFLCPLLRGSLECEADLPRRLLESGLWKPSLLPSEGGPDCD